MIPCQINDYEPQMALVSLVIINAVANASLCVLSRALDDDDDVAWLISKRVGA